MEREKNEKDERTKNALSSLSIVNVTASDYRPRGDVYVKGIAKNIGGSEIKDTLQVEVELLDSEGKAVAKESGQLAYGGLKPNFTDDFITSFKQDMVINWSGSYRLRIGNRNLDVWGEWFYYKK